MNDKNIWMLSGELGLVIALPLLMATIVGVKLDKVLGTTPLCIAAAMIVAATVSTAIIVRKLNRL